MNNIESVLRRVYVLAEQRQQIYDKYGQKDILINSVEDLVGFEETSQEKQATKKLENYLDSLSFEEVKAVQAIMYLGRDEDYEANDVPSEIYRKQKEYFDSMGWNTKEIEISQIVEKIPLSDYIKNGCKILGIQI